MEKVYLLLRNNQESGPFTIDELLQQQLRSSDMIWIEGRSTAWIYLSELELIPHIEKETPKPVSRPSRSADEIERKAEELRQKVLAAAPRAFQPRQTEIESFASPYKLPEDEIHFVDHRQIRRSRKNAVLGELVLTGFVIGLFVLGIYKGQSFLATKHKLPDSVATQLNSRDEHAAQKHSSEPNLAVVPINDTVQAAADSLVTRQVVAPKHIAIKRTSPDSVTTNLKMTPVAPADTNMQKKNVAAKQPAQPEVVPAKKEDSAKKEKVLKDTDAAARADDQKEEKKGGFLRGLFKKKKKDKSNEKEEEKKDSSRN